MDLNEALNRAEPDANAGAAGEFVIDSDLRTISIPAGFGSLGVESDDDVRRLKFRMPKMYGEFDLSEFDIRINYTNAGGQTDIYLVEDKAVDGDSIAFSWLAGRTATKYKGDTRFIVCLKKTGSDGVIRREFNTTVAALPVLEGLEGTEAVVQQNPDIVEEILKIKGSFALADNLTTTEPGKALDARQGQLLNAAQTDINTTIGNLSDRCDNLRSDMLYVQSNGVDGGQSFGKNFLYVDLDNPNGSHNQTSYFGLEPGDSGWVKIPPGINRNDSWIGIRYVLWRNPKHIMVEIHEMYPIPGKLWFNFYNYGNWSGWRHITPQA